MGFPVLGVGILEYLERAVPPYELICDPRRGCGSVSPFTPSIGYSFAKRYQYSVLETETVSQS